MKLFILEIIKLIKQFIKRLRRRRLFIWRKILYQIYAIDFLKEGYSLRLIN